MAFVPFCAKGLQNNERNSLTISSVNGLSSSHTLTKIPTNCPFWYTMRAGSAILSNVGSTAKARKHKNLAKVLT